ncbi:hypothetical protein HSB1_36290 [Halogranum salarium B-1]|uniref:Uncharacterized protein n=1 Tax=Halogranum salarium B-1 TaxID=1210908 RepID=J3EUU2_9EURY|nr:hypothetical protein HSB1_36290 [Halogranum salarium B-1]
MSDCQKREESRFVEETSVERPGENREARRRFGKRTRGFIRR